ncbi:hypothetical protein [Xanthovirga aplysinae]|uniref:hypothetical protein n=1 Tax=Xanthovirga aplysinae TaxID=2529853 RepID=UPI0012BBEAF3|nr:hypothetical protein [Xanthovirga aplysinae]MTI30957.1 hypothetical protein [Xanthovirga aplysinae]
MNKIILNLLFFVLVTLSPSYGQIFGETDAVSVPDLSRPEDPKIVRSKHCEFGTYWEGHEVGYEQGKLDGREDGKICDFTGSVYPGVTWPDGCPPTQDYKDGHKVGYWAAYYEYYDKEIEEKSESCSWPIYYFSTFYCECVCDERIYYFDGDGDGYYDPSVGTQSLCEHPGGDWRTSVNGVDCDDSDASVQEVETWYFDGDDDSYYGYTEESCGNPAKGTSEEGKWSTSSLNGRDCDDQDSNLTRIKAWYFDDDGDNYYGRKEDSCDNPGKNTDLESKWSTSPGDGKDCDDTDSNKVKVDECGACNVLEVPPVAVYIDLDRDGFHSVFKNEDCGHGRFSGEQIRASNFPESILNILPPPVYDPSIPEGVNFYFPIPNSSLIVTYEYKKADGSGDVFIFPDELLQSFTFGEDCNDLEVGNTTWYKDLDGDGYYSDTKVSCSPPGAGWFTTANIGLDEDDKNPFIPALQSTCSDDFTIPSLMKELGDSFISYEGKAYHKDDINLSYGNINYSFDDIIYDQVGTESHLLPNKLIIPSNTPLYGGNIVTNNAKATTRSSLEVSRSTSASSCFGGERGDSEWSKNIKERYSAYSNISGDVYLDTEGLNVYYEELFNLDKFKNFKEHYSGSFAPALAIQIQTFEEIIDPELGIKEDEVVNQTLGGDKPAVIITAIKKLDNHVEYVISVDDDAFKASPQELEAQGWNTSEDEEIYTNQLEELIVFRQLMVGLIAFDYDNVVANKPTSPAVSGLPTETYPDYNFKGWGVLSKWTEFFELGYHLSHHFELPEGTWDPEAGDSNKWRAKAPASVSGVVDESMVAVKDFAEMVKLGQSLVYKSTWVQILESAKNFNIGDQISSMISSYQEGWSELRGDNGTYKQYHAIGELSTKVVRTIYAGWASANTLLVKAYKPSPNPTEALTRRNKDFETNFKNKINKSPEFGNLPKEQQEKLIQDIAESQNDELGNALAGNSKLVDGWKSFKNVGLDDLATNTKQLQKFDDLVKNNNLGLDTKGLEDLLSARTATKGLPWEHPDKVLDATKRASDANIDRVSIKGFPTPAEGNTSFVLNNAKQYQREASGDAFLSFDKGGRSFDNVTFDGTLIDRKYGHGPSIFNADGTVHNQSRANSILNQGREQIAAAGGTPVKWEVSTELGADGIQALFDDAGINIEVVHVAQQTIIN